MAHIQAQASKGGVNSAGNVSRAITIDVDREPDRVNALFASMAVKPKRPATTNGTAH